MDNDAIAFFVLSFILTGCGGGASAPVSRAADAGAPAADAGGGDRGCDVHDPLRRPLFGDLHVHTSYSFDSYIFDNRVDPEAAYRFARGEEVELSGGRPYRLSRPLDFAAVTDHSEFLGEVSLCTTPGSAGYDAPACRLFRGGASDSIDIAFLVFGAQLAEAPAERLPFCEGAGCAQAGAEVWRAVVAAAQEADDGPPDCGFTAFPAYEWTGTPGGANLHRNVIFRNDDLPAVPASYFETQTPEALWAALKRDCLDRDGLCDVLTIPHNSNLGNEQMFATGSPDGSPLTEGTARLRADLEPLVEIVQHKGDSECAAVPGEPDEADALCAFEKLEPPCEEGAEHCAATGDFVREALRRGLSEERRLGVNPFKVGLVGSTDTHNGTAGAVEEDRWVGHAGRLDASAEERLGDFLAYGPGGLAVVWAEENSRDSIFDALRRREAYATSGTRILLRVFGGWSYPADLCARESLVGEGYAGGVPMGGDLPPVGAGEAPRIVVWAMRDPGTEGHAGSPLERLQIVKGWLEEGEARSRVFDVACAQGGPPGPDGACPEAVQPSPDDCSPGPGVDELCTVWVDPAFDRSAHVFYYVRAIESPACRWSTWACRDLGVDCASPQAPAACCDAAAPRTVRERAWSSPIWYAPR